MSDEDERRVLRCHLCNKPFDKQSTLKRHGYYCRSRDKGKIIRVRSCLSCAKRKARCDNKQPKCSRCLNQGIECQYPLRSSKVSESRVQTSRDASYSRHEFYSNVGTSPSQARSEAENSDGPRMLSKDGLGAAYEFLDDYGAINLDWDEPVVDLTDLWDAQMGEGPLQATAKSDVSLLQLPTPPMEETSSALQQFLAPRVSIPLSPTTAVHSILVRPGTKTGQQRSASLMLHTLKSYARMILSDNTLPPFIHPSFSLPSEGQDDAIEPLNNCIAIIHMMSLGTKSSRKLFWKNVRLECERWIAERHNLDRWGLIATLQAVLMYILIRISEGETEENKLDSLLLCTITSLSTEITKLDIFHNVALTVNDSSPEKSWRDWIWEETARRICVVCQSMNKLVYFDPAYMCTLQPDLALAPLPARKQLWEASSLREWTAETEKVSVLDPIFALTTGGDLVKVSDSQDSPFNSAARKNLTGPRCSVREPADWEEWCTGMDGFGSLVILTASLANSSSLEA